MYRHFNISNGASFTCYGVQFLYTQTYKRESALHVMVCPFSAMIVMTVGLPRDPRTGGGVGLLYRSSIKLKQHKIETMLKTFECLVLKLLAKRIIHVAIIYKFTQSNRNRFTNSDFRAEFQRLLSELVLLPGYLTAAGDFNQHMDDPRSSDARQLAGILESMNLVYNMSLLRPTNMVTHLI